MMWFVSGEWSRDERTRHPQSAGHQRRRDCGHHMDRWHDRRVASDATLLATLIWTVVKIAQAIRDFHGED